MVNLNIIQVMPCFLQLAGAIGVIVVDDGNCSGFDQLCFPGSDRKFGEGFASHDAEVLWYVVCDEKLLSLSEQLLPLCCV